MLQSWLPVVGMKRCTTEGSVRRCRGLLKCSTAHHIATTLPLWPVGIIYQYLPHLMWPWCQVRAVQDSCMSALTHALCPLNNTIYSSPVLSKSPRESEGAMLCIPEMI